MSEKFLSEREWKTFAVKRARSKGMTGYQFRAPGEWFAELYACYYIGKMKKGHPARRWISLLAL